MTGRVPKRVATLTHEVKETGDVVVFDERGSQLLLLNDIGAAVWLLLDGQRSVADIARVIVQTLPADPARVEDDVSVFLDSLASHGVIELAEG